MMSHFPIVLELSFKIFGQRLRIYAFNKLQINLTINLMHCKYYPADSKDVKCTCQFLLQGLVSPTNMQLVNLPCSVIFTWVCAFMYLLVVKVKKIVFLSVINHKSKV